MKKKYLPVELDVIVWKGCDIIACSPIGELNGEKDWDLETEMPFDFE